jgi:hypothetical protein
MLTTSPLKRNLITVAFIAMSNLCVVACAGLSRDHGDIVPAVVAPSNDEVIAYVQARWASYTERTSRFQQRRNEVASLIDVGAVSCGNYYGTPDCSFTVTVSFSGGPPVEQRLSSMFDRSPDGTLFETIVLIEERRQ